MIILESEKLIMRRFRPDDLADLFALYDDAEVRQFFPEGTLTNDETREELEWFINGHPEDARLGLWATLSKETGQFIGRCGLLPWVIEGRAEVEIAYLIAKSHWRRGIGGEAARALVKHGFETLGLKRLIALIHPANLASQRTAQSASLAFERDVGVGGTHCRLYATDAPTAHPSQVG